MKLVDRYILRSLTGPFTVVLSAFIMVYVLWDLQDNLGDFIDAEASGGVMLQYYLNRIPYSFVYITPISLLLAILYGLYQLTRNSELTAMRASGISLYRLLTPMLAFGAFMSVAVFTLHETWGAEARKRSEAVFERLKSQQIDQAGGHLATDLAYMNLTAGRSWRIYTFDTESYEMNQIHIRQRRPSGQTEYVVDAETARWLDGQWLFQDLTIQTFSEAGVPMGAADFKDTWEFTEFDETPTDFLNQLADPRFMSAFELRKYIKDLDDRGQLSDTQRRIHTTNMHAQFAMPFACFIAVLLGAPFGHVTARQGVMRGVTACIATFLGYYALQTLMLALGKSGKIPALMGAWSVNLLLLCIGIWLLRRMR